MATVPPVPMNSPVLQHGESDPKQKEPFRAKLHRDMVRFLNELRALVGFTSVVVGSVDIEGGSAAVPTTDIPTPTLAAGTYRASYALNIDRAATTSSAVGVTFGWTQNGVTAAQVFTLVTGNTLASATSDQIEMTIDAGTPVTYAVSYSSVGATSLTYNLAIQLEGWP